MSIEEWRLTIPPARKDEELTNFAALKELPRGAGFSNAERFEYSSLALSGDFPRTHLNSLELFSFLVLAGARPYKSISNSPNAESVNFGEISRSPCDYGVLWNDIGSKKWIAL